MKKYLLAIVGGIIALMVSGCQDTANTLENSDKNMVSNQISNKRVISDSFLRDRLEITGVNVAETAEGLMRVQITAKNARTGFFSQIWSGMTGENPYNIEYKFTWLDKNAMAVDSIISTWQELTIIPGETVFIQSVAPSTNCKDFLVNLKEGN